MKVVNFLVTFLGIYFSVPVLLILTSWNALPGQKLYNVKTSLEDLVLLLTAKTPLSSRLSVSFTERRFSEADKLLSSEGSIVGFELLVAEAETSRDIILKKEDTGQALVLVEKIEKFQEDIRKKSNEQKTEQETQSPEAAANIAQPSVPEPIPTPDKSVDLPKETPMATVAEVVSTLQQTDAKLEQIKKEIKQSLIFQIREEIPEIKEKHEGREKVKDKKEEARNENRSDESKSDGSGKQEKGNQHKE